MQDGKKKKDQQEVRNYVIRPGLKEKFDKKKVYDVIYKTLEDHLKEFHKYVPENAININKIICEEVKNKLKEENLSYKRYKILVHCIVGEKRGQGTRIGSRCLWDTTSDCAVWANYENENVFGFVSAYGVYYY